MDSLVAIIKCNMIYFLQNSYIQAMEKMRWREVKEGGRNDPRPLARWGHCSCLIDDDLIFFGGYADSIYMNDLWAFNTISMQWRQIETKGQKPSPRSNCSLNYDNLTRKLIIFGGGGPNKIRYNSVWILNWTTKQWSEILPKIDQPAPLERTYHSAQLFCQYLIVFGGEGVGDLGDLWIFNTSTFKWNQVHIPRNAIKPCARRFHSSAIIGNEFFILGGCYGKYRCLGDLYSLDLTPLTQGGGLGSLQWKEHKMKNMAFLMRWGHTSAVFEGRIFIFGGRFCSDLGDVLVIDPSQDTIHLLKVIGEQPKPRRRHSAYFSGSSMIIFGGFNGQYFNDLYYLPIKSNKRKEITGINYDKDSIQSLKNITGIQWQQIRTYSGNKYQICVGLIIQRLSNLYDFDDFLRQIDGKYHQVELQEMILSLYKGYGVVDADLMSKFNIIAESTKQGLIQLKRKQIINERQSITGPKKIKAQQSIIKLPEQAFRNYLHFKRSEQCYYDVILSINNQAYFRTSRAVLALKSPYFYQCFSKNWLQEEGDICLPFKSILAFQTVLNYLTTDLMVVPSTVNKEFWAQVLQIADYLVLPELVKIIEHCLIQFLSTSTCQELYRIGKQFRLSQLRKESIEVIIRSLFAPFKDQKNQILIQSIKQRIESVQPQLQQMFNQMRFSLLQNKMANKDDDETSSHKTKGKEAKHCYQEEKQNCSQLKN